MKIVLKTDNDDLVDIRAINPGGVFELGGNYYLRPSGVLEGLVSGIDLRTGAPFAWISLFDTFPQVHLVSTRIEVL